MKSTNAWLLKFMKDYGLSRSQVATAVAVSQSTVDRWLQPKTKGGKPNPTFRKMPVMAHRLLVVLSRNDDFPKNIN